MTTASTRQKKPKVGHERLSKIPLSEICPSPENDKLYRPVGSDDPATILLAESIKANGQLEPIVVTLDNFIVSGHRRYVALGLAGFDAALVRHIDIRRGDNRDTFVRLLREHNRQRDKSFDEKLREELVTIDADDAYQNLLTQRLEKSIVSVPTMVLRDTVKRKEISPAKRHFVKAIQDYVYEQQSFWPVSDRRIHYGLLNWCGLIHASKPRSRYSNTTACYRSLVELVTRMRLVGLIPMDCISDDTRPNTIWHVHSDSRAFVAEQMAGLLNGYQRDLLVSQPNHIEIVVEKNTVEPIIRPIASHFCIPITSGRGYCSIPPRYAMAQRFANSRKSKLVLLILSDFDPDGEEIAHSLARSMRDDFGVSEIVPIKVALNYDQVQELELPPNLTAKTNANGRARFVEKYGSNVFELEAVEPRTLQRITREAIESVLDTDAFNAECEAERQDAKNLLGTRNAVMEMLKGVDLSGQPEAGR